INSNLSRSAIDELYRLAQQSVMVPADQLVFDVWISPRLQRQDSQGHASGSVLLGAVSREVVRVGQAIAHESGIKIQSLSLRSLAKINGLLVHWHDTQEENFAVVIQDGSEVDVGIFDDDGIYSLQTLLLESSGSDEQGQAAELADELGRVFSTVRLNQQGKGPQRLYFARAHKAIAPNDPFVEIIGSKLGVPVSSCDLLDESFVRKAGDSDEAVTAYAAAIGAAMDGLAASPISFNFHHPSLARTHKKKQITWKPFAVAACVALASAVGYWGYLVDQKTTHLATLKSMRDSFKPDLARSIEAHANWNLLREFIPAGDGGNRLRQLNILYEATRLFPDTTDAYVSELTIADRAGQPSGYDMTIKGKLRQSEVVTAFIVRLNESERFHEAKRIGDLTSDPGDTLYPYSFSVSCNLRPPPIEDQP
ncbi:MAG: hypothetical protein IID32_06205, partial [Planctomycetes bacterium]|nr:hypothetical protein [Planctomycetota bacterium]